MICPNTLGVRLNVNPVLGSSVPIALAGFVSTNAIGCSANIAGQYRHGSHDKEYDLGCQGAVDDGYQHLGQDSLFFLFHDMVQNAK